MSQWNYLATAHAPSSVNQLHRGHFTQKQSIELLVVRLHSLEIFRASPSGLEPVLQIPFYARISQTAVVQQPVPGSLDLILLTTHKLDYVMLQYRGGSMETVFQGSAEPKSSGHRRSDSGDILLLGQKFFALHLFAGTLIVVPMDRTQKRFLDYVSDSFFIRLEEFHVVDMCVIMQRDVVSGEVEEELVVLYQDTMEKRHIKSYKLNLQERDVSIGFWSRDYLNSDSRERILVPLEVPGAFLVIGDRSITLLQDSGNSNFPNVIRTDREQSVIESFCKVDQARYLLGDIDGHIYLLQLKVKNNSRDGLLVANVEPHTNQLITDLEMLLLGRCSIPNALCYLDNGVFFVGSAQADSLLVRLANRSNASEDGTANGQSYIEVFNSYSNLASISACSVIGSDRYGQPQLIACCGANREGSLRVVKFGVLGIERNADASFPGINGLWLLKGSTNESQHRYLLLSFDLETRILGIQKNRSNETEIFELSAQAHSFDLSRTSKWCGNISKFMIQVTDLSIQVLSRSNDDTFSQMDSLQEPAGIRFASSTSNLIVIALENESSVRVISVSKDGKLSVMHSINVDEEISSITVTDFEGITLLAVGLWNGSINLYTVSPNLKHLCSMSLESGQLARSILISRCKERNFLFCGLGDGHLLSFQFSFSGEVISKKDFHIGSQSVTLVNVIRGSKAAILAISNRPTLISWDSNARFLMCNLELDDLRCVSNLQDVDYPDSFVFSTNDSLMIGNLDAIRQASVKSYPMGEQPRRIAYQESTDTLCVCSVTNFSVDEHDSAPVQSDENTDHSFIRLMESSTLEVIDSFALEQFEVACSVKNVKIQSLKGDGEFSDFQCYIVGTAFALPNEEESSSGRIIGFKVVSNIDQVKSLELLFEVQTRGAVHALDIMQMKNVSYYREGMGYPQEFLVASVNGMLNLYTFADDPNGKAGITLDFYCSRHCQTYIISISIHENFILSTDIVSYMKIHELQEKVLPNGKKDKKLQLVEVGRDFASRWITAAEFMSRDLLAVADYNCNLFILKKRHSDSLKIDRLEEVAQIHLGDAVNVIAPASNLLGSLNDFDDTEPSNSLISQLRLNEVRPRFIMGCTSGTLSVMCPLSETQFQFLSKIESALETIVYGHGNLSHEKWRSIVSNQVCHQAPDSQTNKCANFIDGDLIELVLSLSEQDQQRVAKRVQIDADDLIAIVQMLHQTH